MGREVIRPRYGYEDAAALIRKQMVAEPYDETEADGKRYLIPRDVLITAMDALYVLIDGEMEEYEDLMDPMQFHKYLRYGMVIADLQVKELASMAGLSVSQVSEARSQQKTASRDVRKKLLQTLEAYQPGTLDGIRTMESIKGNLPDKHQDQHR